MFILDDSKKVIFNMKYHSLRRANNVINIYGKDKTQALGKLVEYKNIETTKFVLQEIRQVLNHCFVNKIYCVYHLPLEEKIREVLEKGGKEINDKT